jgi:hypothetical protein
VAKKASDYSQTWHPGTPKQQSAASRKIAANKRAEAKKKDYPQTWHPGSAKQQSTAARQIAVNKRAAAKKASSSMAKKAAPKSKRGM